MSAITIDTTWLKPTMYDALTADCLTVTTMMVEGRYVAESVEAGDEPNEVHGIDEQLDRPTGRTGQSRKSARKTTTTERRANRSADGAAKERPP